MEIAIFINEVTADQFLSRWIGNDTTRSGEVRPHFNRGAMQGYIINVTDRRVSRTITEVEVQ